MRQCPFMPDLTPSRSSSPACKRGSRDVAETNESSNKNCMTPDRVAEFYSRQLAWKEATTDSVSKMREARVFQTLQEESEARKPCSDSLTSIQGRRSSGVLLHTVYDRQVLWQRQREIELEEQRAIRFEELTGQRSPRSQASTPRRSRSAPSTPRLQVRETTPPGPKARGGAAQFWQRPPTWKGVTAVSTSSSPSKKQSSVGSGGCCRTNILDKLRTSRERHRIGRTQSLPSIPPDAESFVLRDGGICKLTAPQGSGKLDHATLRSPFQFQTVMCLAHEKGCLSDDVEHV
jgi:hypothetical protein